MYICIYICIYCFFFGTIITTHTQIYIREKRLWWYYCQGWICKISKYRQYQNKLIFIHLYIASIAHLDINYFGSIIYIYICLRPNSLFNIYVFKNYVCWVTPVILYKCIYILHYFLHIYIYTHTHIHVTEST